MSELAVAITGVGLWMPGFPSALAWARRERVTEDQKPVGLAFDKINRRRASQLGRAIADVVEEAMLEAAVDPVTTPVVVGSSIGEASTMIGLLDQMWRTHEPMSPAAFTVSVHNAASGLLSISKKNVGFTTSLAADCDTPAAALLEGLALIATGHEAVVVACADEASPRQLLAHAAHWSMVAAAVVLTRADVTRSRALLRLPVAGPATIAAATLDEACGNNPQAGLVDLVDAVQRGVTGVIALDRGTGRGYCAALSLDRLA